MGSRDEFTRQTKKILAERVAWRCSFPGCGKLTIGPDLHCANKVVNLGEAAHIYGAASNGPRYNPDMTPDQRKDISNGIWMCRAHAKLVDSDVKEYTADTLKLWKADAERKAYQNLKLQENYQPLETTTLVSLGFGTIFYARWLKVEGHDWSFEIQGFIEGSINDLRVYSSTFETLKPEEKFIVVESQGEARTISKPIKLALGEEHQHILEVYVDGRFQATNPDSLGMDFAVNDKNELFVKKGNLATVSGVDSAIQLTSRALGTMRGEYKFHADYGSLVSYYYNKYKDDLELLSRLIKMELIRLSRINIAASFSGQKPEPALPFIDSVEKVELVTNQIIDGRLMVKVTLVWGNGKTWNAEIPLRIKETETVFS